MWVLIALPEVLDPLDYLQWFRDQPPPTFDLAGTDLRASGPDQTRLIPSILESEDSASTPSVVEQLATEYDVPASQVCLTSGARHAYLLAILAIRGADRSATKGLVETPCFEPLHRTPAGLGFEIEYVKRHAPSYELEPRRVATAIDDHTAFLAITNRHNPSGHLHHRDALRSMVEALEPRNSTLIVDEVYAPYGRRDPDGAFGGPTAAGLPRTFVVGSVTKFHGLGEIRLGWLIAPEELTEHIGGITMHFPTVGTPNRLLGAWALSSDRVHERATRFARENHRQLLKFVNERDDLNGIVHDGASFGFLTHSSLSGDKLVALAREAGILLVPGRFFGEAERVRIGLGGDPGEVEQALGAFARLLDDLDQPV